MSTLFSTNIAVSGGTKTKKWNPDTYEKNVISWLEKINRTSTGRAVLNEVSRALIIRPYTIPAGQSANAVAKADSPMDGKNASRDAKSCKDGTVLLAGKKGTGKGSTVTIEFTPKHWKCPDNILLHEIVHGIRVMKGKQRCTAAGNNFDTAEEVISITVTNVYRSEQGNKWLRRDHHGFNWVKKDEAYKLLKKHEVPLARVWFEQANFAKALNKVKADFNPFRDDL